MNLISFCYNIYSRFVHCNHRLKYAMLKSPVCVKDLHMDRVYLLMQSIDLYSTGHT